MLNDVVRQVVSMAGATGSAIPDMAVITQKAEKINYISFANMNSNIVEIYPRFTDPNNTASVAPILTIGVYGAVTWPFTDEFKNGFLVYWTNAESGTDTQVKGLSIFYSETNIQMNTSQAPGFNSTLLSANVDIVGNTVGLVEGTQLPAALTAAGNLKVDIAEQSNILVADTHNYGDSTANAAVTVNLGPATAGRTYYITGFCVTLSGGTNSAPVEVNLKDGATVIRELYLQKSQPEGQTVAQEFTYALKGTAGNAVGVTVSAAGSGIVSHVTVNGFYR
jgi:hypothetical protein